MTTIFRRPAIGGTRSGPEAEPPFPREAPFGRIDGAAIAAVTNLYREVLPPGGAILDVMSGWVSHLPPEAPYRRVVGIGIDRARWRKTRFSTSGGCRTSTATRSCPLPPASSTARRFAPRSSIWRARRGDPRNRPRLATGAPLIVTFSNRCVATKPIACWCLLDEAGHLCLVAQHFAEAGNWADIRCLDRTPPGGGQPLYAVIGRSLGAGRPGDSD